MNSTASPSLTPREVAGLLATERKLWLTPMIACGVLAAVFSLVKPRYWEASQALVVRQETAGSINSTPGKFADLFEMRTMQETILELAKSQQVVTATIQEVSRRLDGKETAPTAEDVEKFRNRLKMLPPHGGEFGKTEVFYFYVKDRSRQRAMELVGELCRQLDKGLKQLRAARAGGLVLELQEQVALATQAHAEETERLVEFESQVGADLGELRMLHSASSGQSDLRQESVQLEADVRKFQTEVRQAEQLLVILRAAEKDPQQLVATPNSLLTSQPALRRLKDGLVDAQLATSRLGGTRLEEHPRVKAAMEAETQIREDLHGELLTAIRGADVELQLGKQRLAATQARIANLQERLSRLAEQRAAYSNRVAAVDNSRISLDRARQNLSTAKAAQAAAHSGSLVTRIDQPETGPYPVGLGRTVITGAGAMGGLMIGLGLVFLTAGSRPATDATSGSADNFAVARPPAASHESSAQPEWWETLRASSKMGTGTLASTSVQPLAQGVRESVPISSEADATVASYASTPASVPPHVMAVETATKECRSAAVRKADESPSPEGNMPRPASEAPAPITSTSASVIPLVATSSGGTVLPPLSPILSLGGMSLEEALRTANLRSPSSTS